MLTQLRFFLAHWLLGVEDAEGHRRRFTSSQAWEMAIVMTRRPREEN